MSSNVRLSHGRPLSGLNRDGLTLVEMLVATALTLILFGAVAEMFARMGASVNDARSTIELSGNLRTAGNHLRRDLNNVSVQVGPWVYPGSNQGYFQIIEGPDRDIDFASKPVGPVVANDPFPGSLAGDADDIVSFTAYSKEKPFVGLIQGRLDPIPAAAGNPFKYLLNTSDTTLFTVITSHYAEVVYFTKLTPFDDRILQDYSVEGVRDRDETVTLFRRVLLIRPDINVEPGLAGKQYLEVRNNFDLSVWASDPNHWHTNSLESLQDRRYRVGHFGLVPGLAAALPAPLNPHNLVSFDQLAIAIQEHPDADVRNRMRNRTGEDVLMRKVLAFDVKVFDPNAPIREDLPTPVSTIAVLPGDRAYGDDTVTQLSLDMNSRPLLRGAFVDLNWNRGNNSPQAINTATGQPFGLLGRPTTLSGLNGMTLDTLGDASPLLGTLSNPSQLVDRSPSMAVLPGETARNTTLPYATYDTWPYAYLEGSGAVNGFDDNSDGIVDSLGERLTAPPYPVPLRGMQITIRAIEEGTRIIRQDTVTTNFMPR